MYGPILVHLQCGLRPGTSWSWSSVQFVNYFKWAFWDLPKKNMWFVTFFATIYNRCFSSFLYDKFLIFSRISIQIRAHLSCFIEIFSVNSKWLLISWNCFRAKEYLTRPFLVMLATNCTSSHGGKRKLSDFFYLKDFEFLDALASLKTMFKIKRLMFSSFQD